MSLASERYAKARYFFSPPKVTVTLPPAFSKPVSSGAKTAHLAPPKVTPNALPLAGSGPAWPPASKNVAPLPKVSTGVTPVNSTHTHGMPRPTVTS